MSIHAIRHGLSEANNRNNIGTLAFAAKDAPLMEKGREQAREQALVLRAEHGINPVLTPVAVSELLRTQETAREMGFVSHRQDPLLNEVEHDMEGSALRQLLDSGGLPAAALRTAETLLEQRPQESVWVTHGLVIAGLCEVLGIAGQFERLIPRFCDVRVLPV